VDKSNERRDFQNVRSIYSDDMRLAQKDGINKSFFSLGMAAVFGQGKRQKPTEKPKSGTALFRLAKRNHFSLFLVCDFYSIENQIKNIQKSLHKVDCFKVSKMTRDVRIG